MSENRVPEWCGEGFLPADRLLAVSSHDGRS